MWSGRQSLVSVRDVLAVDATRRARLSACLPLDTFTVYKVSKSTMVAVTHTDSEPYELYMTSACVDTHADVITRLASTRYSPSHLTCRDVRDANDRRIALDVLVPRDGPPPSFPIEHATVITYGVSDGFDARCRPRRVTQNVRLTFKT